MRRSVMAWRKAYHGENNAQSGVSPASLKAKHQRAGEKSKLKAINYMAKKKGENYRRNSDNA